MSALTKFVANTFTDISHKRNSKRLVHDESVHVSVKDFFFSLFMINKIFERKLVRRHPNSIKNSLGVNFFFAEIS